MNIIVSINLSLQVYSQLNNPTRLTLSAYLSKFFEGKVCSIRNECDKIEQINHAENVFLL